MSLSWIREFNLLKELSYSHGDASQTQYAALNVSQSFSIDPDEPIYGLGILQEGRMDMRGTNRRMIQGNTDDYCNIIQSIKGYGLFWDNYSPTTFRANEESFSFISDNGGCIDYYFIYGGDADGVIAGIRGLQAPCRCCRSGALDLCRAASAKTSAELTGVLDRYRELNIPIDCMIQDWQYWGNNYLWNAMEFNSPDSAIPSVG